MKVNWALLYEIIFVVISAFLLYGVLSTAYKFWRDSKMDESWLNSSQYGQITKAWLNEYTDSENGKQNWE